MKTTLTWKTEAGSICVLPGRGRILNIEIGGHEALWSPREATAAWNLGGERLWIGPESDWFRKRTDKVDFDHYQVPQVLDPDDWKPAHSGEGTCSARLAIKLVSPHSGSFLDLAVHRRFELLAGCVSHERQLGIGMQISTHLEILGGTQGQPVDLWSILQIPCGGRMLVPTIGTVRPRDHFDPCPASNFHAAPGTFDLGIGGSTMFKVGLAPRNCAGRIAYARPIGSAWLVLERSFPLHPALRYCDAPLGEPGSQGDALQFFNDGGKFGVFGEIEHRSPALICGTGPQSCSETTVTSVTLMSERDYPEWKSNFIGSATPPET